MTWTHIVCIPFVHACVFLSLFVCVCAEKKSKQREDERGKKKAAG